MKTIGLCKALSCGDFIPAVLHDLYPALDALVFVMADTDWLGNAVQNEVIEPLTKWQIINDEAGKIHILKVSGAMSQEDQYAKGVEYIDNTFGDGVDWLFLFDTDEVWQRAQLFSLLTQAENATGYNSICTKMRTYIKSPRYRITPDEPLTPCVMVRALPGIMQGVRGNNSHPRIIATDDVYFHHYSYVRATDTEIMNKAVRSTFADGLITVDLDKWYTEKWSTLPNAQDFHTTKHAEHYWKCVSTIDENEVPVAVRELEIYQNRRIA